MDVEEKGRITDSDTCKKEKDTGPGWRAGRAAISERIQKERSGVRS